MHNSKSTDKGKWPLQSIQTEYRIACYIFDISIYRIQSKFLPNIAYLRLPKITSHNELGVVEFLFNHISFQYVKVFIFIY